MATQITDYGRESSTDQAHTPAFRLTLAVQAAAALVFGVAPLLATAAYASALGFSGADALIYRIGAAATLGYVVAPLLALAGGAGWPQLRIPAVATVTFTVGAFLASSLELLGGARQPVIVFVVIAGAAFTAIAAYWLRRDQGAHEEAGRALDLRARAILVLAVASAAVFGLFPLLAPATFATVFGLSGTDGWVYRLAGAGCLGYATAGLASLAARGYRLIRVQNFAAITFNALAAVVAILALAASQGGWLAPVVAVAATFFTVALSWLDVEFRS